MSNIDKLKKLVLEGGYDVESRKEVANLEDRVHRAMIRESLVSNPIIQDYLHYLNAQADKCTYLLSNDRSLTEIQREVLHEKRDICLHFSRLLTGEQPIDIEKEINELLNEI